MKIVAGLGNPGSQYARTRHNIGFMVADELTRRHDQGAMRSRFKSVLHEAVISGEKVVVMKPQTYMNLSGIAVAQAVGWFKAPIEDLLIIADDVDLPFGSMRLRERGSSGGQRGVQSVIDQLGSDAFTRLRVGVGRGGKSTQQHVLSHFAPHEREELDAIVARAADAVELWISDGAVAAMNRVNRRAESASGVARSSVDE